MYRIDDNQNVAELPADPTDNVGTPGYFTGGNPSSGIPATRVRYWWLNMIQEELAAIVEFAGLTLSKDTRNQVLTAIKAMFRTRVVGGTLTFYVSTTGADTNDGLTAETPLATIQQAIALASTNYDITGTVVQIILAAGTYGAVTLDGTVIRAKVSLVGPGSAGTTITSATTTSITIVNGANCTLSGLTIANTSTNTGDYGGGSTGLFVGSGSICNLSTDVAFGSCASGAHMWAYESGVISALPVGSGVGRNYTITGGATMHYYASLCGTITLVDATVTLTGTPNFSTAFAVADQSGAIGAWGNTYSGSATGARISATGNGTINAHGAGASYFPGNADGSQSSGGQYY